ncbi:MAG: DUF2339 domain-containing protein [Armatimonadetes bacterium]|nr:DUF2339 domain-containing protein [Armatimonadota bacterium]
MVDDDLRPRIERLEAELAEIKSLLEGRARASLEPAPGPETAAPPSMRAEPPIAVEPPIRWPPAAAAPPEPPRNEPVGASFLTSPPGTTFVPKKVKTEPTVPAEDGDVEFRIGGRYMTIAGAVVVVLGLLFLVVLAVSNGWITPPLQFAGELALCAAFVGIGLWKIDERENFGQTLVGVGACGTYLSFAGAYAAKHVISSQAMIVAFIAVSLACLALSFWRSSQAFFSLGLLGGFLAVVLPLREADFVAARSLHPILLVPSAIVVWRKRWTYLAYALFFVSWTASLAPLVVAAERGAPMWPALIPYYLFGLGATAAYAFARQDAQEGKVPALAYGASTAVALMPFSVFPSLASPVGALTTGLVAVAFGLLARLHPDVKVRQALTVGAMVTGALVAPFALTKAQAAGVYAVEAAVAAVLLWKNGSLAAYRWAVALCLAGGSASFFALAVAVWPLARADRVAGGVAPWVDALTAVVLALVATAASSKVPDGSMASESKAGLALLAGTMVARAPFFVGIHAGWSDVVATVTGALMALVCASLSIVLARTLVPTLVVGVFHVVFLTVSPALTFAPATPKPVQALLMSVSLAALVAASVGRAKIRAEGTSAFVVLAGLGGIVPFCWAAQVGLTALGSEPMPALVCSMAVYSALVAVIAVKTGWNDLAWTSAAYAGIAVAPYVVLLDSSVSGAAAWSRTGDLVAACALMFATVCTASAIARALADRAGTVAALAAVPFGLLACRAGYLLMTAPGVGVQNVLAVLLSASVFACALSVWSIVKRYAEVAWTAAAFLGFGLALYPPMKIPEIGLIVPATHSVGRTADMASLAALFATALLVGRALWSAKVEPKTVFNLLVPVEWALWAGLLMLALTAPPFAVKFDASLSLAWIAYGAALIAFGFWRGERLLRYWGLTVFGSTLVKVFFYDLAFLEVNVKVVVFIGFGIVMLTASHAYIRSKRFQKPGS